MKRQRYFLIYVFLLFLVAFILGKFIFVWYNADTEALSFGQTLMVCLSGLLLDIRVTAFILLIPALLTLQQKISLRWLQIPYFLIVSFCICAIVTADIVMYEFWKFKLGAVVLSYAASPEATTSSVSTWFLVSRVGSIILGTLLLTGISAWLTPKHSDEKKWHALVVAIVCLIPFGIGTCHHTGVSLFKNHAATNSVYAFVTSFWTKRSYNRFDDKECKALVDSLYPSETEDITDTLLKAQRPCVLIVQMESYSGKFIKELGGLPDVSPNFSRLVPQGIFWDEYYSNSFRTDRGTVSIQSGIVSHPTISLMRDTQYHHLLNSLPRTFNCEGYETSYLYAGAMTNMGKRKYLEDMDIQHLYDKSFFTKQELGNGWGATDQTAANKLLDIINHDNSSKPWFITFQTLSSHEPWKVPYKRLKDEKLNAFAYTDQCIGDLVDSLHKMPIWDNLLIILIPDHGFLYGQTFEDQEFFHSPMLWLGGAIKQPRTMHTLMNQSDLAATLLSQLGISHKDYRWSRNVLSKNYSYPFVYCNFPAGIMLKDSTGVSIFDLTAKEIITEQPKANPERIRKAQAILQESYRELK